MKFTLNRDYGKIIVKNFYIPEGKRSTLQIWKNNLVKAGDVVFLNIGGFSQSGGIPYVYTQKVLDDEIRFVLANPDNAHNVTASRLTINFHVLHLSE